MATRKRNTETPAPAPAAPEKTLEQPTVGGSYTRDPATGKLTRTDIPPAKEEDRNNG